MLSCDDAVAPGLTLSGQVAMPETADPSLAQFSLRDGHEGVGIAGLLPKRLVTQAAVGLVALVGRVDAVGLGAYWTWIRQPLM